ncbi:phage tail protein [Pseudomonas sp. UBA6315]|uniref:phage tail-collar fiber domain-containing protein n=1 Tax=Pseudomonas sp. UBA6315 TaxID=1947328 RepID=UPI002579EBEB|nr:phage tail protein [Pseudomonas sp. UBA6315]
MVDQTSQFYAILTNVGAAKQANADALGIAWKITQMGVGDANGTDPTPNATQTSLLNEWRRAPLNQLKVDDKNSAIIIAEQVIPADVGGKWIREIALYDADGDMVAVANCAPTYKPLLSQGSGRTQVVRMNLVVSSASNVQLKIDPAVVLATREWVTEELARQDFKHSVQVATTANIALTGLQTVDGIALSAGARVLVKNQTLARDNGIYEVAAGAWSRSADADTDAKITPGLLVLVEKGSVNSDSAWQLVTDGPLTLGVSAQAYEMAFGRSGVVANTYRSVTVDKYGRVTAATNPTTVAGYGLTDVYTKTQVDSALALKAPLANPALTGAPTAPTAATGNNSQQIANTAFVQAAVAGLVDSAPAALDTLKELAAALGNDPNFATTVTNTLATKAAKATTLAGYGIGDGYTKAQMDSLLIVKSPLTSPAFEGMPTAPTAADFSSTKQVATTEWVQGRGMQYSSITQRSAAGTLAGVAAHIGGIVHFWGNYAMGYTLPNSASLKVAVGAVVRIQNWCPNSLLVGIQGNDKVQTGLTVGQVNSITIPPDTFIDARYYGDGTWIMDGTGVEATRLPWQVSGINGNGYHKFPSGLIVQWGGSAIATPASPVVTVTFPVAFPNRCTHLNEHDITGSGGITRSFWQFRNQGNNGFEAFNICSITFGSPPVLNPPVNSSCAWYAVGF